MRSSRPPSRRTPTNSSANFQTAIAPWSDPTDSVSRAASAILRDAEILVLDEATSQIDVESERLIHESLARYVENRTVIMITHRASTLALADSIVHVEHGTATKKLASQHRAA